MPPQKCHYCENGRAVLDFKKTGILLAFASHTFEGMVTAAAVIEDTQRRRILVVPATWVKLDHSESDDADGA